MSWLAMRRMVSLVSAYFRDLSDISGGGISHLLSFVKSFNLFNGGVLSIIRLSGALGSGYHSNLT